MYGMVRSGRDNIGCQVWESGLYFWWWDWVGWILVAEVLRKLCCLRSFFFLF